ncbi:hypothetical protein EKM01_12885 [Flavobacterium sp. RSP46]|uniref:hypothetical protein n=1 Tax=Flavobacterium sp. RSP46 TaxID=2497486 RepID=UPI000F88FAE5|nr:hypothetical protein [Flavobacterium sp. RSP46]RTY89999.1 hypothetical protein EKM01_12885 [Flavobacterium sp. RSP46]
MKKIILILISLLSLQSCKNDGSEIEKLKEENKTLKEQIIDKPVNVPKYVWTVITYKTGSIHEDGNGQRMKNIKTKSSWTDIIEVPNFDYTTKLKMQDEFESQIRQKNSIFLHSILKRETYEFSSYVEASEFKYKTINK